MKKCIVLLLVLVAFVGVIFAQDTEPKRPSTYNVDLTKDPENGWLFSIDGKPTPLYGMVWSFTPIGEKYTYNLWNQPEAFIKQTIDIDAKLMQDIGVNVIRCFSTIPPKWVQYFYEKYGIYTAVNYLFGRYGITVNQKWIPRTDYSDKATRKVLIDETLATIEAYKDVPGVLMFLLGNENNYGLEWSSFEIENLPKEERHREKGKYLYEVFGEAVRLAGAKTDLPIGIVNGDILYIDLIKQYAPEMDFLAANVYRGKRTYDPSNPYSTPFFEEIEKILDKPVLFSEFGADAYNTVMKSEDQYHQAEFLTAQWEELFQYSYGKGRTQNAIGGFVFEWMDEWWKRGLDSHLDTQETRGSWINGGYSYDFIPEQWDTHNNMNEEWLGIVSQSQEFYGGNKQYKKIHKRVPRAAYYALGDIWDNDMFQITEEEIQEVFSKEPNKGISVADAVSRANDIALREKRKGLHAEWLHLSLELAGAMREHFGNVDETLKFSYEQTANLITQVQPTPWMGGRVNLRFQYEALDNVFDESYSYSILRGSNHDAEKAKYRLPVEFYSASFLIETDFINVEGFFHDGYKLGGHPDWKEEGDFFGLLPETFYMYELDKALSKAPFGIELSTSKFEPKGLKLYIGPEIFKESRPSMMAKYYREFFGVRVGALYEQELEVPSEEKTARSTEGRRLDKLRNKASLLVGYSTPYLFNEAVRFNMDLGVLYSGGEKLDEEYTSSISKPTSSGSVELANAINKAKIQALDTLAFKGKFSVDLNTNPVFNIWVEYIYAGLVAESRWSPNRTGGFITDNGTGNKHEFKGGLTGYIGSFSFATTAMWRTPVSQPINDNYFNQPYRRDPNNDPFIVNGNRETLQAEVLVGFDPTGSTYFHEYNNDDLEDAVFAGYIGYHHTFYNNRTDRLNYKSELGTYYLWDQGLTKAEHLPALKIRMVSNFLPRHKVIYSSSFAQTQNVGRPNIDVVWQYSGKLTYLLHQLEISPSLDWNVFGPEDWHAEFGLRIPLQWSLYFAYHLDKISLIKAKSFLFAEVRARHMDFDIIELDSDVTESSVRNAVNPRGNSADDYRMSVSIGYKITF